MNMFDFRIVFIFLIINWTLSQKTKSKNGSERIDIYCVYVADAWWDITLSAQQGYILLPICILPFKMFKIKNENALTRSQPEHLYLGTLTIPQVSETFQGDEA